MCSVITPPGSGMSFLLETKNLSKRFVKHLDLAARMARKIGAEVQEEIVQAVDRVDLSINQGEVVGLVVNQVVENPPSAG